MSEWFVEKYHWVMKNIWLKYEEVWLYLIFGVLTTLINFVVYLALTDGLGVNFMVSNVFAFIGAVLFAYVTNKIWVFKNRNFELKYLLGEIAKFFSARIVSFGMDMTIMYVFVEILSMNDLVIKIFSNILVIILNYILSKFLIFAKKGENV